VALTRTPRLLAQRVAAVVLLVVVVPGLLAIGTLDDDQALAEGEISPRTVFADRTVRVVDRDATEEARRQAAQDVDAVVVPNPEARAAIVSDVRMVFAAVRDVRRPVPVVAPDPDEEGATTTQPQVPPVEEQVQQLSAAIDLLDEEGLRALVELSSSALNTVESETVSLAQQLARRSFTQSAMDEHVNDLLSTELPVRAFPGDIASLVVRPLIEAVARPTMVIDPDATELARERAAAAVPEVAQTFEVGDPIVEAGSEVSPLALQALEELGLQGVSRAQSLLRALAAMLLVVAVGAAYLWRMQPKVWSSGRKVLLMAVITTVYAAVVAGVSLLTGPQSIAWWYIVPAGALAMLTAIMVHPVIAIAMMLPAAVLVLASAPVSAGVAVYVAAAVLVSVPLVNDIGSRGDLRSATLRAGLAMPAIAAITVAVFGPRDQFVIAVAAAALAGVANAIMVQGFLPFLENLFRLPTVTALLDLGDRNHPLLRELETKAIGSYNHSVMVASLVERACREVGANALLGSVAALYHDIGKVRRPHFFIENQQGIANPHDDLDPEISAVIIQEHVIDGVKMAREYKLPPEVVACIGSHHGTMVVSYFYRQAVERAGGEEHVDEDHYRYKGTKPKSKEAGILVIADCSEATTRSMAMHRGTLPREEIEATVDRLLKERMDDDQFAECDLTFDELHRVRDSIVEALVGIYHPRIAYPSGSRPSDREDADVDADVAAPDTPDAAVGSEPDRVA
jgi:cyclic-di-AMP phosphodiesterase PgpH